MLWSNALDPEHEKYAKTSIFEKLRVTGLCQITLEMGGGGGGGQAVTFNNGRV